MKRFQFWKNFDVSKISNQNLLKIAIIPARGGSKSIPRKNLQKLLGVPLLAYSIDSALRSRLIDDVYVSTEDSEIADISQKFGAKVIVRPDSMATDISRDDELLSHAINCEFSESSQESLIIFLRPSHPLRNPETLNMAINLFENSTGFDSLRSMKLSSEIPYKMWTINDSGMASPLIEKTSVKVNDPSNAPRQLLPKTYYQDGYVDIFPFKTVIKYGNTMGIRVMPFITEEDSQDIDSFKDLEKIKANLENNTWPQWFKIPNQFQ